MEGGHQHRLVSPRLDGAGVAGPGEGDRGRDAKESALGAKHGPVGGGVLPLTQNDQGSQKQQQTMTGQPDGPEPGASEHLHPGHRLEGGARAAGGLRRLPARAPRCRRGARGPASHRDHRSTQSPRRARSAGRSGRPGAASGILRPGAGTPPGAPSGPRTRWRSRRIGPVAGRAGSPGEAHHHDQDQQPRHQGEGGGERGRQERAPSRSARRPGPWSAAAAAGIAVTPSASARAESDARDGMMSL